MQRRSAILAGDTKDAGPAVEVQPCRRRGGEASLMDVSIPRVERRRGDQRREPRFQGLVERATITFRGKTLLVPVVNASGGGMMVEAAIMPCIGEIILVNAPGRKPLDGVVRWVKDGRVGLDLGEGAITV